MGEKLTAPVEPLNAADVREVVEKRLEAVRLSPNLAETTKIEWRGTTQVVPVISMPVSTLSYNPHTHRVRAQRTLDPERDALLDSDPYGPQSQAYLYQLLREDPAEPGKIDSTFELLRDDLKQHGQSEPGIITRSGVLINGNTRRAALTDIGAENILVGVLPSDAGMEDLQAIELSLQLRREHKRDYSFMNFLLALDERLAAGRSVDDVCTDFRIRKTTLERNMWILGFIRQAIERSKISTAGGKQASMRLAEFEAHKGKLEELYTAYTGLKDKTPAKAEALREQRLLAIALNKSKTDLRLIGADFTETYMSGMLPTEPASAPAAVTIPGTGITTTKPGSNGNNDALKALTDKVLQAKAVEVDPGAATPEQLKEANNALQGVDDALGSALTKAGKQGRVIRRRFQAVDRLSDATESIDLAVKAVAEARQTNNFNASDLDEQLTALKHSLANLARAAGRNPEDASGGLDWLRNAASLPDFDA